jgi:alkanesulfonate monooxygenase SsuD/methylene tetrahydromethanopterin reductase-like flavin-dependent oxidoreductase (luciferase family)
MFAAAAARTLDIVLGTSIIPTYPRHPIVMATQALVLASIAPGRFRLGVGPSHRPTIEGTFGIPMDRPLAHLREYMTVLRELLWEGKSTFEGQYFKVNAELQAEPPKVPLPISALRAGAFRLAGEIADGGISWMAPVPYLVNVAKPAMEEGAKSAGRPCPPLVGHIPVAMSSDAASVHAAARQQVRSYGRLPFYIGMFEDAGFPLTEDGQISDALLDELVVSGSPDVVASRLQAIQAAGVDELVITQITVQDEAAEETALIELLAEEAQQ